MEAEAFPEVRQEAEDSEDEETLEEEVEEEECPSVLGE